MHKVFTIKGIIYYTFQYFRGGLADFTMEYHFAGLRNIFKSYLWYGDEKDKKGHK